MSNSWFRFKRFTVEQSGSAMKVGTDGVLLGAWARIAPRQKRFLDIGTGTGLIALMLAQRTDGFGATGGNSLCGEGFIIDAVEADGVSALQAAGNCASSPWANIISIYHTRIQEFLPQASGAGNVATATVTAADRESTPLHGGVLMPSVITFTQGDVIPAVCGYDHIISNPPWFVDSLESPDPGRSAARHAVSLTYDELLANVKRLLHNEGIFSVILPAGSESFFLGLAAGIGFGLKRRTEVFTLPGTTAKRVLLEFALTSNCKGEVHMDKLVIANGVTSGDYTEEYKKLTGDFYLRF